MSPVIKIITFLVITVVLLLSLKTCQEEPQPVSYEQPGELAVQSDQDNESEAVVAVGTEISEVRDTQRKLSEDTASLKEQSKSTKDKLQELSDKVSSLLENYQAYTDGEKTIPDTDLVDRGLDLLDDRGSVADDVYPDVTPSAKPDSAPQQFVWHVMDIKAPATPRAVAENISQDHLQPTVRESEALNRDSKKPTIQYVIPSGTLIEGKTLTGVIGRIPINGQVTDPWQFKVIASGLAYAPNHKEFDVSGMIFEGVAQGDYSFKCARGRINKLTAVLADGSVTTIQSDAGVGIAWISDAHSNPCLRGTYISNMKSVLTKNILLNFASGAAEAAAEAERTQIVSPDGVTQSVLTGDSFRVMGANAIAQAANATKDFINNRNDAWDAIHVPAGQEVIVHVSQELLFNHDKTKQIYDEKKIINTTYSDSGTKRN